MDDRVKTALERAMERAGSLGEITPEEVKRLENVPLGNTMGVRYLKEPGYDLEGEISKKKGTGTRKYILKGIEGTLLGNIELPRDASTKSSSKKALQGLILIKENKKATNASVGKIETLFSYYEQARQQLLLELKKQLESRQEEMQKTFQYRIGANAKMQMESQQQFQEEARASLAQLDRQYSDTLEAHKQELENIP